MTLLEVNSPPEALFHIGRVPDPLAWPDSKYVGVNRFDDPNDPPTFRVLYAAEQRIAAFVETLQKWRPSIEALAALESVLPDPDAGDALQDDESGIPADWHAKRGIGSLRLLPGQHWLDLREHETRETLRSTLAAVLQSLGHDDFDLGDAISRDRRLTQAVARFAFDNGFQGIAYKSRFDQILDCWAIFEGAQFEVIGSFAIAKDDPDLLEAARRFNLKLP